MFLLTAFFFLLFLSDDCRAGRFAAGFFAADHCRAGWFAAGFFAADHCHGRMAGFFAVTYHRERSKTVVMIWKDDDLVRLVVAMTRRRRPFRMHSRTRFGSGPAPFIFKVEPAFIIRDVFILIKHVAVLRNADFFRTCHDHRARRGRDDFLRGGDDRRCRFHDNCFFDDRRCRFHDDRSRARLNNRAHQPYNVGRQLYAVGRMRFVVFPCERCRGKDDRRSESSADSECLVDGLLSRVSYGREVAGFQSENRFILDFLIILYFELFDSSNRF